MAGVDVEALFEAESGLRLVLWLVTVMGQVLVYLTTTGFFQLISLLLIDLQNISLN